MLHVLLLLPLLGCDGSLPDLAGLFGDDAPPAALPMAPPVKDLQAQLEDLRGLMRAGKGAEAAKGAEALLAAHPEEDAAWEILELVAFRSGVASELVDRLSADQAIGGRGDRHHALRGVLAVEANRLGDAINAARALRSTAPGDAAAILALAVARGAPVPDDATAAERALLTVSDASVPIDGLVEALPGWRVALVRAEARLARGDRAGAAMEAAVADAGGPRARGLAARIRVRAAATGDEAWAAAEPAARAELEAGDGQGAAELLDAALPAALRGWKAHAVADVSGELRGTLTAAGNGEAAARVAVVEAEAALRAGLPLRARDAAQIAAALPAMAVRANWTLALASAALGSPAEVNAAAATLAEPRASAARDLAKALTGQNPKLPSAGLDGADAALQALLGAGWLAAPGAAYEAAAKVASAPASALSSAAVSASPAPAPPSTPEQPVAAGSGASAPVVSESVAPDLALWARLAAGRAPVAAPGDAAPAFVAEQSVREWLASGGSGVSLAADLGHPGVTGWNAILGGTPAPADAPGVAAWPRARAALAAADAATAAKELGSLSTAVPAWRSGPWAPLAAMDGPRPSELDADAATNAASADPLPFAVIHHGWSARVGSAEQLWSRGIAPFPATATPAQRAAVWDASAAYRGGVLAWLAGRDAWPAAASLALDEAEKAAGLTRFAPPSLASLRSTLDGEAILSFRARGNGIEALYLGEENGKVKALPASVAGEADAMLASLRAGRPSLVEGDRLRARVIDGAMDVLLGVGRYIVVGSPPMGLLPVAAMPEQIDGLRFLASIRHVGYLPDFDALLPQPTTADTDFRVTMFALCASPEEALAVRRVYPDAQVLEGAAATVAAYKENAGQARFLHVGAFPASPDGGFQLGDGALTLADIAAQPLLARGVFVNGGDDPATIAGRTSALRQAGATDMLVEGWPSGAGLREAILLHFWEGQARRYSASRSLSEARTLAVREAGDAARVPAGWSGYLVSGRP